MQEMEEKVGGNIVRRQEMEEMEERVGGSIVTRRRRRNISLKSNISIMVKLQSVGKLVQFFQQSLTIFARN